ncbi:hypothetical protein BJ741DRAFT_585049 [Chytriomyces cf. hyalinus JEL632]|nr:hypothetical protein BJ741DRAFT_585049 [Chytriomyces cf. hyalinus JEL632]
MSDERTNVKRTILNKTNYPVWKRLTLVAISKVNARTLSPTFTPFVNRYLRHTPPDIWVRDLTLAKEFRNADDPEAEGSDDDKKSETESETATEETPVLMYKVYGRSEKIWLSFQKCAQEDDDALRNTLNAIHGGMSKSMQAQYSLHDTPASLCEELRCTKDPSNRMLDTSAADTYRELSIREKQTIPNYIKRICAVEDACTAAVRLRLDHRFAQAVIVLTALKYDNVIDLEKTMIDL